MELAAADLSIHICPLCHHAYRLSGVRPGQEIVCFKCGEVFQASQNFKSAAIPKIEPFKKKEPAKMTQAPALAAAEPIADSFSKPKRQGGTWTWLVFLTFVLFCFVKAVSLPVETANFVPVTAAPAVAPAAEPVADATASAETLRVAAVAYFDSKEFAPAAEKFAAFLAAAPKTEEQSADRIDAWWKLGMARENAGDPAGAIAAYEGMIAEFGKEKDWKIRVGRKALERLAAGTAQ